MDGVAQVVAQLQQEAAQSDTSALHTAAAAGEGSAVLEALVAAGGQLDAKDAEGNTPLHIAAREDQPETCRALSALGADALARNAKGRTPRGQPGLSDEVREVLLEAEELSKKRKAEQQSKLWDDKMRATQTASACRLGCL